MRVPHLKFISIKVFQLKDGRCKIKMCIMSKEWSVQAKVLLTLKATRRA